MTIFKYVAQDSDGQIFEHEERPKKDATQWLCEDHYIDSQKTYKHNLDHKRSIKSWKSRCFNLEKFGYCIAYGKLIGIPKNCPDWLLRVKEIDIKAFDWITRGKCKQRELEDILSSSSLTAAFSFSETKQGSTYWNKINSQI